MELDERIIERIVHDLLGTKEVIALGASKSSEELLKKLALKAELEKKSFRIVPSGFQIAAIAASLGLTIEKPSTDIDLTIEFAEKVDKQFNYNKKTANSLVRDKILAKIAKETLVIVDEKNFVDRISGTTAFEITKFAWHLTMDELESFGNTKLRMINDKKPFLTETGNYIVDVELDEVHSLVDVDMEARKIPGVIETGLFLNYADKVLIVGRKKIELKKKTEKQFPGLELMEIID